MGIGGRGSWGSTVAVLTVLVAGCGSPQGAPPPVPAPMTATSSQGPTTAEGENPEATDPVPAWRDAGPRHGAMGPVTTDADGRLVSYTVVKGDWLDAVAARFGVAPPVFLDKQVELGTRPAFDYVIFEGEVFRAPEAGRGLPDPAPS